MVLIDNNESNINKAKKIGLEAFTANIYSDSLTDNIELNDVGYLMALTGNSDINKFAIKKFEKQFGENGSFRLVDADEMIDSGNNPKEGLFSHTDDFIKLIEAARKYPAIHEITLNGQEHYQDLIAITNKDDDIIPIFLKTPDGELKIISSHSDQFKDVKKGYQLVYLGKMFDIDETETALKAEISTK